MLHTRTSTSAHRATIAAILPVTRHLGRDLVEDVTNARTRVAAERAIDDVIAESFPASDPPSWNPGIARLAPLSPHPAGRAAPTGTRGATQPIDVIDVSRPEGEGTFFHVLLSWAGAVGVALMVPLVILLIGLPFVLALRGLLQAISWLFGFATL